MFDCSYIRCLVEVFIGPRIHFERPNSTASFIHLFHLFIHYHCHWSHVDSCFISLACIDNIEWTRKIDYNHKDPAVCREKCYIVVNPFQIIQVAMQFGHNHVTLQTMVWIRQQLVWSSQRAKPNCDRMIMAAVYNSLQHAKCILMALLSQIIMTEVHLS